MMRAWVLLVTLATSAFASNCYYPDGNKADDYDYEPCGSSITTFSTCCYFGEGDVCLENGLCKVPNKYDYYRAACANKDWSGCPEVCMDEDPDNWLAVEKCGENKYCCPSSGSSCCTNGAKIYTLNATNPDASSSSATASSGSDSASTDSSDGQTTTSKASSGGGSVPTAAIAGGVVGGVVLIGFLLFGVCCFRRRRKQSAPAAPDSSPSGMAAGVGGAGGCGSDDKGSSVGHQESLAEAEGGLGKVFTEVDSKPVTGTGFDEKTPFYVQSTPSPVQNSHQQGIAEAPGSLGTVFTEADSKPVTQAALDEEKPFYTQPASSPAQQVQQPLQQGFVEVEGDSKLIPLPRADDITSVFPKRGVTPVQEKAFWHHGEQGVITYFGQSTLPDPRRQVQQSPQQGVAQVDGSFSRASTEVDSKPVTQAALDEKKPFCTQPTSNPAQPASSSVQQVQDFAEVEGDSKPIPLPRVDEMISILPKRGVTPVQEQDHWYYGERDVTEIEGSAGKAFPEDVSKSDTFDAYAAQLAYFEQRTLPDPRRQVQQSPRQGVAQVDGGFRKVSTEVESKPGVQPDFHASNPFYGRMTSAGFGQVGAESIAHHNVPKHKGPQAQMVTVPKEQLEQLEQFWQSHQSQQSQQQETPEAATRVMNDHHTETLTAQAQRFQQGATEVQGSPGRVFTEADSRPVITTSSEQNTHTETTSRVVQQSQQQIVAEVEGGLGNMFTEADSRPVNPTSELNGSRVEVVSVSRQQVVAEADGTTFPEADSKPVNPTS